MLNLTNLNLDPQKTVGNKILHLLMKILNDRERKLDRIIDNIRNPATKFHLTSLEFQDAILERYYDIMRLTPQQRDIRKLKITCSDLIFSVINALQNQLLACKVWFYYPKS